MPENGLYRTDNLYIAAALLTEGKTLLRPERNGTGRILFVFRDDGELQRLTERFWASELRQPVNEFAARWRDLRKLISNF